VCFYPFQIDSLSFLAVMNCNKITFVTELLKFMAFEAILKFDLVVIGKKINSI